MSGQPSASLPLITGATLGVQLRRLREKAGAPGWKVAAAAEMDSGLLSKIETGKRLPTQEQLAAFAAFFKVDLNALELRRVAEDMKRRYGDHPQFLEAATMVREEASEYPVKKMSATASKRAKPVNKR